MAKDRDSEILMLIASWINTNCQGTAIQRALFRIAARIQSCEEAGCWEKPVDVRDGILGQK